MSLYFIFDIKRKNMNPTDTHTPERETFIRFPHSNEDESRSTSDRWHLLGARVPQAEIVYFCQMIIVYIIIITSIINLSLQNGASELWISLLSSCIGYALPSPKLKK
jgi:hypothetical protein